jgi:hypothetical protein
LLSHYTVTPYASATYLRTWQVLTSQTDNLNNNHNPEDAFAKAPTTEKAGGAGKRRWATSRGSDPASAVAKLAMPSTAMDVPSSKPCRTRVQDAALATCCRPRPCGLEHHSVTESTSMNAPLLLVFSLLFPLSLVPRAMPSSSIAGQHG